MKSIIKRRLLPLIQTNPHSTVPLPSAIISSIKEDFHCLFKKFPVRIHLISSTNSSNFQYKFPPISSTNSPNFQYKFGKHTASFIITSRKHNSYAKVVHGDWDELVLFKNFYLCVFCHNLPQLLLQPHLPTLQFKIQAGSAGGKGAHLGICHFHMGGMASIT